MTGQARKRLWGMLLASSWVMLGCRSEPKLPPHVSQDLPGLKPHPASIRQVSLKPVDTLGDNVEIMSGPSDPVIVTIQDCEESEPAQDAVQMPPAASTGHLNLTQAIETALAQNPDLITLRETENVALADLGIAQTYPFNPIVQTRVLPFGRFANGGGNTSVYNYVLLWQTFEMAHQQSHREDNSTALLESTRWTVQQANLLNVSQTVQFYFTALYQKGLRDLARDTDRLNQQVLTVTKKRTDLGKASATDLSLARLDARSTQEQARLASITFQNALRGLQRHLNLPPDASFQLAENLTDFVWDPITSVQLCQLTTTSTSFDKTDDRNAMAAKLVEARPDVLGAQASVRAAEANLRLAQASRVPNLTAGPFYIHDASGTLNYGFQAQMELPVINNGKPLVRKGEAQLQQQLTTLEQMKAKARVEALTALERYEQSRGAYSGVRGETVRQLTDQLKQLEKQFTNGEIDILRVIQARNSLIQYQRTWLDSLNELAQASAALITATGLPPAAFLHQR